MERRRVTTAGVLFWTPAPDRTSPTDTVTSEDAWEDEEEDEEGADRNFVIQMDENGIIGLSEALGEAGLGETFDGVLTESKQPGRAGKSTPEDAGCGGCVMERSPDELSSHLRDHLDRSESAGEVSQVLPPCYGTICGFKALTEDEQRQEHLPEGVKYLDMGEEKKSFTLEETGFRKGQNKHISSIGCPGVSDHHHPVPQSVSTSVWSHLFHLTAEELTSAQGIEGETFPEMNFTESLPDSDCSHTGLVSSPRCPEMNLRASPQPAAASLSKHVASDHNSRLSNRPREASGKVNKLPVPLPRKAKQPSTESGYSRTLSCSTVKTDSSKSKMQSNRWDRVASTPGTRFHVTDGDDYRKGSLSYHTADFSKVEPKVHFPKDGYTPPKSKLMSTRKSLSPEPPLMFKSPAEIVKEVLLNNTGKPCLPSNTDAVNSTVPQEFRCREQATTLLEQLQEDYNRLLTKYAEAENTIDRLRLEAKVNLYSDPPVAGHFVHSGLNHNLLKLDFSQCQRAEVDAPSCPDGHNTHKVSADASTTSRSSGPQLGQHPNGILVSQTYKFLQQLQTFEDLIKSEKLKPLEKVKGLSQLTEGLNSLEKGYLLAQDEHRLLQHRGAETCHFDPERGLEGLIFQCGLRVDELKEQMEHIRQEHPTCEASPSPAPHPTSSSSLSDDEETLTYTQDLPGFSLVDPGDAAQMETSSASKGSREEEAEDEGAVSACHSRPQIIKHRWVTVDHIKDGHKVPPSAASKIDMQCGGEEEEWQGQRTRGDEVKKTLPKRKAKPAHQDPPAGTNKQRNSRSSSPLCRQLPVRLPHSSRSSGKGRSNSSSLSSFADLTTPETRSSKAQTVSRRVLSQDGIVSPETDSGFVGSEGSNLTAAAPSVFHQRALESTSGVQDGNSRRPEEGPADARCPSSSSSPSHMVQEPRVGSQLGSKQARRAEQNRTYGEAALSGSEVEYANSINSLLGSCSSSSPASRYHHSDFLRALSPTQVVNYNEVIHSLQAEMTLLKEKLESCLRNKRAALSAQSSCSCYNTSAPRIRSAIKRSDGCPGKRGTCISATQGAQQHFLPGSKMETSASRPQPRSQVDICTQTSATPDSCCSQATTVHSRTTQNQPVCSYSPAHTSPCCHRCVHCGCCEPHRCTEPDLCKQCSPKHLNCQAARSPDRAGSRYSAAETAPPPPQGIEVCPPQLLWYSSPVIVSPRSVTETSPAARWSVERRRRTRRSLSVDKQGFLDSSLDRAVRAARQMKHTSGHMAHSLAEGLQFQELLTQS